MLPFHDPKPEEFLRELGFDCVAMAVKGPRAYFLKGDLRLKCQLFGPDMKKPDYILVEHLGGASYRALVQTGDRYRVQIEVETWRRMNQRAA